MLDKSVWQDDLCHERRKKVVEILVSTEYLHGHNTSTIWYIYEDSTKEPLMMGLPEEEARYYAKNLRECLKEASHE